MTEGNERCDWLFIVNKNKLRQTYDKVTVHLRCRNS